MDESVLALLVIFGFFAFIALAVYAEFKISDVLSDRKEAKRRKEHPEFFRLYDEYDEKGTTACRFYNTEIAPRKRNFWISGNAEYMGSRSGWAPVMQRAL